MSTTPRKRRRVAEYEIEVAPSPDAPFGRTVVVLEGQSPVDLAVEKVDRVVLRGR